MTALASFISLSLDGYYVGAGGDMGWAHSTDAEQQAFTADNARGGGRLVFGRTTYDMMASFWPTQAAEQSMPEVARHMNALPKIVFSRSLKSATWNNTLLAPDLIPGAARLKAEGGPDLAILGSGSIVAQLIEARLLDELQIMTVPKTLGGGRRLFDLVNRPTGWSVVEVRHFKGNGAVFIRYRPG